MRNILKIPVLGALLISCIYAEEVSDSTLPNEAEYYSPTDNPVEHIRAVRKAAKFKEIYQIDVDIDNDGKNEIVIGSVVYEWETETVVNDRHTFFAEIFKLNEEGKYVCMKSSVPGRGDFLSANTLEMNKELSRQFIPELNCHGLLMMDSGKSDDSRCVLEAVVLEGNKWKNVIVEEGIRETHYAKFRKLFENPLPLKEIDLSKPVSAPAPQPAPVPAANFNSSPAPDSGTQPAAKASKLSVN